MCCNVCCNYHFMKNGNDCSKGSVNTCIEKKYSDCKEYMCREKLIKRYKKCKDINSLRLSLRNNECEVVINEKISSGCKNGIKKEELCKEYNECITAIDNEKLPENYKGRCKDICKVLIKISTILNDEEYLHDKCTYFNYWTYEQLWNGSKTDTNIKLNSCVSDILQKIIWTINHNDAKANPCYFYFDEDFNVWKNEKHLHDYFKNHDHIKSNVSSNNVEIKYCEYVTSIVPLYKDYLSICCTYFFPDYHWDHCPKFFKCGKEYSPNELFKELNCETQFNEYPEGIAHALSIDRYVKEKSEIEKQKLQKKNYKLSVEVSQSLRNDNPLIHNRVFEVNTSLTSDHLYITIVFAYTVLGIFFLFFLFYKFTPLGSLVDRKINMNKQMKRKFQKNSKNKLQSRKLQQGQGNARKKRISIAYNSK